LGAGSISPRHSIHEGTDDHVENAPRSSTGVGDVVPRCLLRIALRRYGAPALAMRVGALPGRLRVFARELL
jgi:hypothetical protein